MIKETNLEEVKNIVRQFLYLPLKQTDIPFIVSHPIFVTSVMHIPCSSDSFDIYNEKDLKAVRSEYSKIIDESDLSRLYIIVRKPYRLVFLKHAMEYLSLEDFSHYFADAWVMSENPNQDVNCSIPTLIGMFKATDKRMLMTEKDYEIYNNLPQKIRVYRGVGINRNPKGISWTDDIEKAEWFANRFNTNDKAGYVLTTEIDKSKVLAYFNIRGEKELVCDTRKSKIERL